nr:MAG TPA: hypothetical protein [Inoviridae sp.]
MGSNKYRRCCKGYCVWKARWVCSRYRNELYGVFLPH